MDQGQFENRSLPVVLEPTAPTPQSYWDKVAGWYKIAFRVLLIALPLFVVIFVALCSRAFTYDSMFCFFKDLRAATSFIPSDYGTVTYTYEEGDRTVLDYRGGVAAVTRGGVEIYSPDGDRLLELSEEWRTPRAVASRKYLVAYDFGSNVFTVTNAYARLHRGDAEAPIYGADVSNTGHIALITAGETHLSQVLLYDPGFHLIQRFSRADSVVDVQISDNGKYVAILSLSSSKGEYGTVFELYRIGEAEAIVTHTLGAEMPEAVGFTDDRHVTLLTDKTACTLKINGDMQQTHSFSGKPVRYAFGEGQCMILLQKSAMDASFEILVFNKKGETEYTGELAGCDITAISLAQDCAFLHMDGEVLRISLEDAAMKTVSCERGATDIFAIDDERVRAVYAGKAEYIYFGEERE